MKDKKSCIEKIKEDIKLAKYDEAIQNATNQIRALEEDRETLNMELKNLTLQADSRAKLDINRADLSKKRRELQDILDSNAMRFKAIIGSEIEVQSMENEVDKTTRYGHEHMYLLLTLMGNSKREGERPLRGRDPFQQCQCERKTLRG